MKTIQQNTTFAATDEKTEAFPNLDRHNELISDLKNLGLEEDESIVYLGLLHTGPITIGNMSVKLRIERGKAYRLVEKLRNLGLVTTSFSNPTVCTAIDPDQAICAIIENRHAELITMQKISKKIISVLSKLQNKYEVSKSSYFSIVQSRLVIYDKIGQMIKNSSSDVIYLVTPANDLARMYHTAIPEKIQDATKNGTKIRILTESHVNLKILEMIKKFGATEIRLATLPSKGRMIVENNGQLIMSNVTDTSLDQSNSEDAAVHTNSPEIVQNMWTLCEHLWRTSKDIVVI